MSVQTPSLSAPRPPDTLETTLRAAKRRIRGLLLLRYGSRALCVSALVCLLAVGLSKLRLFETPAPELVGGILAGSLLLGLVWAFFRPLSPLAVAKTTESRANLKERLSSAVEFKTLQVDLSEPFYQEQWADANQHAAAVNLKTAYPVRLPRALFFGILATLALFLSYFLPTLPAFWSPKQKMEAAQVKTEGAQIVRLAQDVKKEAEGKKLSESKKAAEEARKLGEAMKKGKLNKKQSLVEMQKLTRQMAETQKKLAASLPAKTIAQSRKEFQKSLDEVQKDLQKAQQAREGKQEENPKNRDGLKPASLEQSQPESESMKQAREMMQKMQEALASQNDQQLQQAMEELAKQMQSGMQNGAMSPQEQKQMLQAMEKLAGACKGTSMEALSKQMQQLTKQLAQQMQQNKNNLDPKLLKELAELMKKMGTGMCNNPGGQCNMEWDNEMLKKLLEDLKNGRLKLALGQGKKGGLPIPAPVASRGKGGNKAGLSSGPPDLTKNKQDVAKKTPNAQASGKRGMPSADMQITMMGDPERTKSVAPYYQTYQTNKRAAESALNKENIPAAYKKQVRDYFDSIKP